MKNFFIKLVSITVAIIVIINVVFNLILAERLQKFDQILSMSDVSDRKNFKNKLLIEIEKGLSKKEMIDKEDKVIILKLYNKIKKEFDDLEID
ncbi:hypothetical protein OAN27_04230 [Pelagibacteraceae bacterium]|nr:hypothetical protein [Pelagibacteraceae bacterium]